MVATPNGRKRSGGPRTNAGKAAASQNAFKGGMTLNGLINESEQALYAALIGQLRAEYAPRGVTLSLLLQGFAMALVKRQRQDRVESALYEKAQVTAAHVAAQPVAHSFASYLPSTPEGQARARKIMVDAAMPEMQRVDAVARYGTALDRQIARLLAQIKTQREMDDERDETDGRRPQPDRDENKDSTPARRQAESEAGQGKSRSRGGP